MPRDPRTARRDRPGRRKSSALRRTLLGTALAGALVVGGGEATGLLTLPGTSAGDVITRTVAGDASITGSPAGTASGSPGADGGSGQTVLTFHVPSAPRGYVVSQARIAIRLDDAARAQLGISGTNDAGPSLRYQARSGKDAVDGRAALGRGDQLTLDVIDAVPTAGGADVSVSVPVAIGGLAAKQKASHPPKLVLKFRSVSSSKPRKATQPNPGTTAGTSTPPPAPVTGVTNTGVRIGMSAPNKQWAARLAETGSIDARRVFGQLASPNSALKLARSEVAAGRMPILSFKVPGNDWSGVAAGKYDAQLRELTANLAALGGKVFVTLHHEPSGDGTPADYAAMMRHALPILGAPASVDAGPIVNGYWWSKGAQGLTDAQIAQWLPADVLRVSETVAADTYQGGTAAKPGEDAGVKIRGLSAWATRVGVKSLGIGEYNGLNAAAVKAAGDAILADPRYSFATIFNSDVNNRAGVSWTLVGERLTAFKSTVAEARS